MRLVISLLLVFCTCLVFAESSIKYWCTETNVVMAISAYERERVLPNGERIRTFSTDIDPACTNYTAVLFTVLHPARMKGRFVRLSGPGDEGPAGCYYRRRYDLNTLYYIPIVALREHGNQQALEPFDLFEIGNTHSTLNVESQRPNEYFWKEDEVKRRVSEIRESINVCSNEVKALSSFLRDNPRPGRDDPRFREWARNHYQYQKRVHSDLPYFQIQLNDLAWQIQQIRRLDEVEEDVPR